VRRRATTDEEKASLPAIRDYLRVNVAIELVDFTDAPALAERGGIMRARAMFRRRECGSTEATTTPFTASFSLNCARVVAERGERQTQRLRRCRFRLRRRRAFRFGRLLLVVREPAERDRLGQLLGACAR
jgi:hypothetical protein